MIRVPLGESLKALVGFGLGPDVIGGAPLVVGVIPVVMGGGPEVVGTPLVWAEYKKVTSLFR